MCRVFYVVVGSQMLHTYTKWITFRFDIVLSVYIFVYKFYNHPKYGYCCQIAVLFILVNVYFVLVLDRRCLILYIVQNKAKIYDFLN